MLEPINSKQPCRCGTSADTTWRGASPGHGHMFFRVIIELLSLYKFYHLWLLRKTSERINIFVGYVTLMQALEPNRNYLCTKQSDSAARYILLIGRGEIENIEGQVK